MIEGVERRVQIIEENKANQRESEVGSVLRENIAQLRAVYEAAYIVERGSAKQRFDSFHDENRAVGARDGYVAPKEEPHLAKREGHSMDASTAVLPVRPVSRRNACSREASEVRRSSAESVSHVSNRPLSMMAIRSANVSTSASVCEAKRIEVAPDLRICVLRKCRNSDAAMTSMLRVGSSRSNTLGRWSNARARLRRCTVPEESVRTW